MFPLKQSNDRAFPINHRLIMRNEASKVRADHGVTGPFKIGHALDAE